MLKNDRKADQKSMYVSRTVRLGIEPRSVGGRPVCLTLRHGNKEVFLHIFAGQLGDFPIMYEAFFCRDPS